MDSQLDYIVPIESAAFFHDLPLRVGINEVEPVVTEAFTEFAKTKSRNDPETAELRFAKGRIYDGSEPQAEFRFSLPDGVFQLDFDSSSPYVEYMDRLVKEYMATAEASTPRALLNRPVNNSGRNAVAVPVLVNNKNGGSRNRRNSRKLRR